MVYQFPQVIQYGVFSCVEDLKCDFIETVLRTSSDVAYTFTNILLKSDLARKLYTELLKADVNGFSLRLFDELTNQEVTRMMTEKDYVVISVSNQGEIFVENKIYPDPEWLHDFWYVQDELSDVVQTYIKGEMVRTLVFSLK